MARKHQKSSKFTGKIDVGWIDPGYVGGATAFSIAQAVHGLGKNMGLLHRSTSANIYHNRNQIMEGFLAGGSEWLYCVDADMYLDEHHIWKLLQTARVNDVKMVGGLTFIYHENTTATPGFFVDVEGQMRRVFNYIPDAPFEAMATGMASVLIHRDVVEAMTPYRHYERRWFDDVPPLDHWREFLDEEHQTRLVGEDVFFFLRARDLGFKLIIDPDAKTDHAKTVAVNYDLWRMQWPELTED